jgi:hypothetical protein
MGVWADNNVVIRVTPLYAARLIRHNVFALALQQILQLDKRFVPRCAVVIMGQRQILAGAPQAGADVQGKPAQPYVEWSWLDDEVVPPMVLTVAPQLVKEAGFGLGA